MSEECAECGELLRKGDRFFQLARGHYFRGYITPTYADASAVLLETHENHLADFDLEPQCGPYKCVKCEDEIQNGKPVAYGGSGSKPAPPYKRPEARGYLMPFIAHLSCWQSDPTVKRPEQAR